MTNNNVRSCASPIKRFYSFVIDIAISFIPSVAVAYKYELQQCLITCWFGYFLSTIIFTTVSLQGTLGDWFMKLEVIGIDNSPIRRKKLIFRQVMVCIFLLTPILDVADVQYSIVSFLTFAGLSLTMFSKSNRYGDYLSAIDLMFKTKIVEKINI